MSGTILSTLGPTLIPVTVMTTYQVGATVIYTLTNEHAGAQNGWGRTTISGGLSLADTVWCHAFIYVHAPFRVRTDCLLPFLHPFRILPSNSGSNICAVMESVVNEHSPLAGSTPHHFNLYVLWKQLNIALVKSDRLDSDTQPSNTNYMTLGKLHIKTTGYFFYWFTSFKFNASNISCMAVMFLTLEAQKWGRCRSCLESRVGWAPSLAVSEKMELCGLSRRGSNLCAFFSFWGRNLSNLGQGAVDTVPTHIIDRKWTQRLRLSQYCVL